MLENSQMRENMLLQYADDIIKVEMGSLRGEMLRLDKGTSGRRIYTNITPRQKRKQKIRKQIHKLVF